MPRSLRIVSIQLFMQVAVILFSVKANAQTSLQLWNDYNVIYPFASSYSFDVETSYQTLLSQQNKWRSIAITPTLEWSVSGGIDLILGIPLSTTWQTDSSRTSEARISIGARIHFTPSRRIQTRLVLRYEPRFVHQENEDEWQKSNRIRARAEAIIPINHNSYFEDKLWYGLIDFEVFVVPDELIDERFANRFRLRIGVGYRFNYSWRLEGTYAFQQSRSTLEEQFTSYDSVIRIRLKHFLNASKPAKSDGNVN